MAQQKFYMTQKGYDAEKARLLHMQNEERVAITERIAEAKSQGDLSENAEYDAAMEDQGKLEATIRELEAKLENAEIVDESELSKYVVSFGSEVKIKDVDAGIEFVLKIVSAGSESTEDGVIVSDDSPVAKALQGRVPGDIIEIDAPKGKYRYQIIEIL